MKAAELRVLCVKAACTGDMVHWHALEDALGVDGSLDARAANTLVEALDDAAIPRWRPIETAPLDVWILARRDGAPPVVVRRRDRKSPVTLLMETTYYDDLDMRIHGLAHWSPIPTEAT